MTTWLLLNSLALAAVSAVLYVVLRQLGFVLHRVGPTGARSTPEGPRIGENVSHYLPNVAEIESPRKARLIVFASDACSICAAIRSGAEELARSWRQDADILLIYDCENEGDASPLRRAAQGLFVMRDCHLRRSLGATFVPFGIVTDSAGTVVGKGLVNEIAHLESLLELERSKATDVAPLDRPLRVSA